MELLERRVGRMGLVVLVVVDRMAMWSGKAARIRWSLTVDRIQTVQRVAVQELQRELLGRAAGQMG